MVILEITMISAVKTYLKMPKQSLNRSAFRRCLTNSLSSKFKTMEISCEPPEPFPALFKPETVIS